MSTKYVDSKRFFEDYGPLTFGEVLRCFRVSDELTQSEFARKLSLSPANLCDLEKGRKIPSAARAVQIAKKLGLPPQLLIQVALQDSLRQQKLDYTVTVAA